MLPASQVVETTEGGGGKAFMRFDFESGAHTFGREAEDITDETIVVNLKSFAHGWTLWSNGKPTKSSVSFTQPLPASMPPIGADSPVESRAFEARFEDDNDTVLVFATNSYGGRKGCDTLLDLAKIRAAGGEGEYLYPVVSLTSESYANAKRGGKLTYNPLFKVVDWANEQGEYEGDTPKIAAPVVEEVAAVEEVAPKKKRRTRKTSEG
jgi:hypothetical protein